MVSAQLDSNWQQGPDWMNHKTLVERIDVGSSSGAKVHMLKTYTHLLKGLGQISPHKNLSKLNWPQQNQARSDLPQNGKLETIWLYHNTLYT